MTVVCSTESCWAKHRATERQYQEYYNDEFFDGKAKLEHRLPDRTRIDIYLPNEAAIEVDFAAKWAECIGQATHYGRMTDTQPTLLLIMEKDTDQRYVDLATETCKHLILVTATRAYRYKIIVLKDTDGKIAKAIKRKSSNPK